MRVSGPYRMGAAPDQVQVTPAQADLSDYPVVTDAFGEANDYNNPSTMPDGSQFSFPQPPGEYYFDKVMDSFTGGNVSSFDTQNYPTGSEFVQTTIPHALGLPSLPDLKTEFDDWWQQNEQTVFEFGLIAVIGIAALISLPAIIGAISGERK